MIANNNRLIIIIASGQNLNNLTQMYNNYSGMFVQFLYENILYRTSNQASSSNITWNEQFIVPFDTSTGPPYVSFSLTKENNGVQTIIGTTDISFKALRANLWSSANYDVYYSNKKQNSQLTIRLFYEVSGQAPFTSTPLPITNTPLSMAVSEIMSILPQVPRELIEKTLNDFNGDKEKALASLLDKEVSKPANTTQLSNQSHLNYPAIGNTNQPISNYGTSFSDIQLSHTSPVIPTPPKFSNAIYVSPHSQSTLFQGKGRKKSLLIGINYYSTRNELKGCNSDIHRFRNLLVNYYGFPSFPEACVCLSDEALDPRFRPTKKNILYALKWLVQDAQPGDIFVFFFSGHGTQLPDYTGREADGLDEAILPEDWKTAGPIRDNELHNSMVAPLPSGTRLTAVMDCCHSGTALDLPYIWSVKESRWKEDSHPFFSSGDVQLISGCTDAQSSMDLENVKAHTAAGGALTTALITTLMNNPYACSYPLLLEKVHQSLLQRGLRNQFPQLSSTQRFSITRCFNFSDIIHNTNKYQGRNYR